MPPCTGLVGAWPGQDANQPRCVCFQVGERNLHFVSKVRGGRWAGERAPPLGDVALCGVVVMLCPPSPSPSAPYPQILLFSEPDFLGDHVAFEEDQDALPAAFVPRSCRVRGGR